MQMMLYCTTWVKRCTFRMSTKAQKLHTVTYASYGRIRRGAAAATPAPRRRPARAPPCPARLATVPAQSTALGAHPLRSPSPHSHRDQPTEHPAPRLRISEKTCHVNLTGAKALKSQKYPVGLFPMYHPSG